MILASELQVKAIAKIVVVTLQIIGNLSSTLSVKMPDAFKHLLDGFIGFFSFDLSMVISFGCWSTGRFTWSLYVNVAIVGLITVVIALYYLYAVKRAHAQHASGARDVSEE
eukprot:COSAG01_NODE_54702_length_330_cov_0.878788_1_plen_110_part_11